MLKITLYKNCILNETYQNVFSVGKFGLQNRSPLDKYLSTLSSLEIIIDDVYYKNSGTLVFDYLLVNNTETIYEYNYMKFELLDDETSALKILRYCFVQDIRVQNDVVYLDYDEDVWSSYCDKIEGITESYLEQSRILSYQNKSISLYNLNEEYNGNNKILVDSSLMTINGNRELKNKRFKCLIELQLYTLESAKSTPSRRISIYVALGAYAYNTINRTISEILTDLNKIVSNQPKAIVKLSQGGSESPEKYYYEVGDIYLLPSEFLLPIESSSLSVNIYSFKLPGSGGTYTSFATSTGLPKLNNYVSFSRTIEKDFKKISVGTILTQIPLEQNGTSIDLSVLISVGFSTIAVILSIKNKLIDITKDFRYELLFTSITSSEYAQRVIGNKIQNLNINTQKELLNLTDKRNEQTRYAHYSDLFSSLNPVRLLSKGLFGGRATALEQEIRMQEKSIKMNKLTQEQVYINSPQYSSASGSFGNIPNLVNIYNGIVIFKIDADNYEFVKKSVNNFGFKVYEFLNDISLLQINDGYYFLSLQNPIYYNVIKFNKVNVYGEFPRDIAIQLNNILESSIKLWYDYKMRDDNYVSNLL